jgi:hypothetical protein
MRVCVLGRVSCYGRWGMCTRAQAHKCAYAVRLHIFSRTLNGGDCVGPANAVAASGRYFLYRSGARAACGVLSCASFVIVVGYVIVAGIVGAAACPATSYTRAKGAPQNLCSVHGNVAL